MRKLLFILVIGILFNSCALYIQKPMSDDEYKDEYYKNDFINKTNIYYPTDFNVDKIHSLRDISNWINERVTYKKVTTWDSCEDILERGYGDCKHFSLLFLNLYFIKFGLKGDLAFVDTTRKIIEGGQPNHSLVIINNIQIEPQNGMAERYSISFMYSHDKIFN